MTPEPRARLLGAWILVEDDASARHAVQMAGLPVFLMGLNAGLVALIAAVRPDGSTTFAVFSAVVSLALVTLSFRVRAGHAAWLPGLVALFFLFLLASITVTVFAVASAGDLGFGLGLLLLQLIVPVFLIALALGGLRGWRWLKAQGRPVGF